MKLDLAVIGEGAVTPAGVGMKPLLRGEVGPIMTASADPSARTEPVFRVDLEHPAFQRWQKEARLRRVSPLTLFLIEAAEQALENSLREDRARTGLIVAYSAGCLAYSRRFFEGLVKQGRRTASPALFPETVFNSPGSHVASVLGLNGAAYALVGDETAWIGALKTAAIWLRRKRVKQVLVLGAEEFDPLVLDAYRSARWLRGGFRASEGAAGVLLRLKEEGDAKVIEMARDGLNYRHRDEVKTAAVKLFEGVDSTIPFHPTASCNWLASLEKITTADRPALGAEMPYLGEAFTASAAWNTVRALTLLTPATPEIFLPIWGLNQQLGALTLTGSG